MNDRELDELLDAHFLGDATGAERARLEESLRADSAARRRFVQASFLEARLYGEQSSLAGDDSTAMPAAGISQSDEKPALSVARRSGVRRFGVELRRFDLAALAAVVAVAITGYYFFRLGSGPRNDVAIDKPPVEQGLPKPRPKELGAANVDPADDESVANPDGKSRRIDGYIETVDGDERSFVLAGLRESRTTFRAGAASPDREAAHVLLDGVRSTFEEAVRSRRLATVTFVPSDDGPPWAWKVEVSSSSR